MYIMFHIYLGSLCLSRIGHSKPTVKFTCAAGVARVLWLLIGRIENSLMGRSSIILLVESPKMDIPEDGRPHGA